MCALTRQAAASAGAPRPGEGLGAAGPILALRGY